MSVLYGTSCDYRLAAGVRQVVASQPFQQRRAAIGTSTGGQIVNGANAAGAVDAMAPHRMLTGVEPE